MDTKIRTALVWLMGLAALFGPCLQGCNEDPKIIVKGAAFVTRYKVEVHHPTGKPWYQFMSVAAPTSFNNYVVITDTEGELHQFRNWCIYWRTVLVPVKPEAARVAPVEKEIPQ